MCKFQQIYAFRFTILKSFWCFPYSVGYFIVQTTDPLDKIMVEEIFGPFLTICVYKDKDLDQALNLVGSSTQFVRLEILHKNVFWW